MALIDTEGFGLSANIADYYTYGLFIGVSSGGSNTIATGGPFGDNYAVNGNAGLRRVIASVPSSFIVGFRALTAGGSSILYFQSAAILTQFVVVINSVGQILVTSPASTVWASSAAGVVTAGVWCYLEVAATISSGAGAVTVRLNGVMVASATGINTQQSSTGGTAALDFGDASGTGHGFSGFTHLYLLDLTGPSPWNNFLGDVRVQTLRPTADHAVAFTPIGLGSNWQNGAIAPPMPGADYNLSSTVGAQDTFVMAPMSSTLGTVFAVNLKTLVAKSDAGQRTLSGVVISGGTPLAAPAQAVTGSSGQIKNIYETNPAGGNWSHAAVDNMFAGYVIVS